MQEIPEGATVEVDLTEHESDIVVIPEAPQPPANVMLDIETWGTGNKALVVSLGACKFDGNDILDKFHVAIDPVSAQAFGLEIDASTILWWLDPARDEARRNWLSHERVDLVSALLGFHQWCHDGNPTAAIWGNGSTFDNVILRSAFAAAGLEYPVKFRADQCYRTVKNRSTVKLVREGTHHNALDDAISQAKHLQAIWREDASRMALLQMSRDQFRFYEHQHMAKDTPEATQKAVVNRELADKIDTVLPESAEFAKAYADLTSV
jgi:exodeoxyribonuclease VIII